MKKIIYILLISSIQMFGQDSLDRLEMRTEAHSHKLGFNYHDQFCDTLSVDSKMIFFKKSPITNLKGYTKVFNSEEIYVIKYPFTPGGKGYFINWVIKNNRLYIQHITLQENRGKFKRTEDGKIIEIKYNKLKESEIKRRIEQFTGEKFNKQGLYQQNG